VRPKRRPAKTYIHLGSKSGMNIITSMLSNSRLENSKKEGQWNIIVSNRENEFPSQYFIVSCKIDPIQF